MWTRYRKDPETQQSQIQRESWKRNEQYVPENTKELLKLESCSCHTESNLCSVFATKISISALEISLYTHSTLSRGLFNLHFLREQQFKRELNNILFYPHHFVLCFFKELTRGILRSDVPGQKHFLACQVSCQCLWNRATFNWLTCNFPSQFRYIEQMND